MLSVKWISLLCPTWIIHIVRDQWSTVWWHRIIATNSEWVTHDQAIREKLTFKKKKKNYYYFLFTMITETYLQILMIWVVKWDSAKSLHCSRWIRRSRSRVTSNVNIFMYIYIYSYFINFPFKIKLTQLL